MHLFSWHRNRQHSALSVHCEKNKNRKLRESFLQRKHRRANNFISKWSTYGYIAFGRTARPLSCSNWYHLHHQSVDNEECKHQQFIHGWTNCNRTVIRKRYALLWRQFSPRYFSIVASTIISIDDCAQQIRRCTIYILKFGNQINV